MLALQGLVLIALTGNVVVTEQAFKAGDQEFSSCAAAREYAESLETPITVECHVVERHIPQGTKPAVIKQSASREPGIRLSQYKPVREIKLDDRDASGIAFLTDELLLITYQDWLEFRDIQGQVQGMVGPVDGDIEGLEYQDGRLVAVDEQGSTHLDLDLDGMNITVANDRILMERGIECIAHDPLEDIFYYGVESSGDIVNDKIETQIRLARDLAACTVHRGEMMAITSHPWRQSIWYRLDMTNWSIIERVPLPAGDWEGIACRANTCVLVRESSEKSDAAMVIYRAEGQLDF